MAKQVKAKLKLKVGDLVELISGNDKGKRGQILEVIRDKNRAVVEGINVVTKHIKPSNENPEGGQKRTEAPVHISNLALVDPKSGKPTKVGRKLDESTGKLKRYSKTTGEFID